MTKHEPQGRFGNLLRTSRERMGLTQQELADRALINRSVISRLENGLRPQDEDILQLEQALAIPGELTECARSQWGNLSRHRVPTGASLTVLLEIAEVSLEDGWYVVTITRQLKNNGSRPATSYLAKIQVDRYPEDPQLSADHHHRYPLTLPMIKFQSTLDSELIKQELKLDGPAIKELYLHFESSDGRRPMPLLPGQVATLRYSYRIPDSLWGPWFQRAIRLPTDELLVRVSLPSDFAPVLWAKEMSYERHGHLEFQPNIVTKAGATCYEWRVLSPILEARYRIAWRLNRPLPSRGAGIQAAELPLGQKMRALGILPAEDPALRTVCEPFDLPTEAMLARDYLTQVRTTLERVELHYPFAKGSGLAANQIGLARRAAVVRSPTGHILHLINPEIVRSSPETDVKYEGCLSLFDARGKVQRPLVIDVRHQRTTGEFVITQYEDALARLVAHEIDHLDGKMYTDFVQPGDLVPFEEYRLMSEPWDYGLTNSEPDEDAT